MKKQLLFYLLLLFPFILLAQQSYYNDVDLNLTGLTLRNNLATKITTTHTNNLFYTPDVWNASMVTDVNPSNAIQVLLMYGYEDGTDGDITNDRERGINNNGGNSGEWNREHVYANSLGTPDLDQGGTDVPPYTDAHNLRPCDTQRNSSRSNKLFITGSGNSGAVNSGWYPGDEWRGDVARMILYLNVRYGETFNKVGTLELFLKWNKEDPVSDFEIQRNDVIYAAQGNRNPFIDNPYLATLVWSGEAAQNTWE